MSRQRITLMMSNKKHIIFFSNQLEIDQISTVKLHLIESLITVKLVLQMCHNLQRYMA